MVEGRTLQSRYRIDELISSGGMGTVYAALDERLNRPVAVKVLKEELTDDPRFVERFRREARAVASLSHSNIAAVFDYGQDSGRHFIVMELVRGQSLDGLLHAKGPLSPGRAAAIGQAICAALAHAHGAGVVHRDVKPGNVIVGDDDHVKMTDFGIARAVGESRLTATGSMMGTAQYIAPEQASGLPASPASDIYSTGILIFEMLTGTVPFSGESAIAIAMRHASEHVPAPSSVNRDVPPAFDAVVARATAKSPEQRFPDARAMGAALRDAIGHNHATPVRGVGAAPTVPLSSPTRQLDASVWPVRSARRQPKQRRTGRAVLLLLLALGAVAAGVLVGRVLSDDPAGARGPRDQSDTEPLPEETPPAEDTPVPEETPAAEESPAAVTLDDYRGTRVQDASKALAAEGFTAVQQDVDSLEEKHTVIETDPPAGTAVTPGVDTITLFVSTGKVDEEDGDDD
jgi:eukaryotic-like serine/threonine-protein kinase